MSKVTADISYEYNTPRILREREYGMKKKIGVVDDIAVKIYKNLDAYSSDIPAQTPEPNQGGIFNLEYSLDGGLLVAACEESSVLVYDPANQRLLKKIPYAHARCVNCVRFLTDTTFVTCSDDNTVKIWDIRNLGAAKLTLHGHSNWVKNIEYSEKEKMMVTSAFDGTIYAWDLNSPTEDSVRLNKVLKLSGLVRTKLTPDGTKMVICTTGGYMLIIHELNLMTLYNDMKLFRPDLYRLMQSQDQSFPAATMSNHLFAMSRDRNRIEFIDDFPNQAEVISSLQIHPMGWCAVSRNVNAGENEEWTAVHDIQTRDPADYEYAYRIRREDTTESDPESDENNGRATDIWMGFASNEQMNNLRSSSGSMNIRLATGIISSGLIGSNRYGSYFRGPDDIYKVILNIPRLTHYREEKNVGKGFIKELCFSSDGRLICSPYDKGVRLLAFNDRIQELCYCVPDRPQELFTVSEMNNYHSDVVVCCKFSPRQYQMVSGCLGGEIVWYRPVL